MSEASQELPAIPAKRYFTIGEVSELCGVKPYVLRYWEQEFTQLRPMKRRGNRRYYQHHEVLLVRRIRELLYDRGFTISGARNQLMDGGALAHQVAQSSLPEQARQTDTVSGTGGLDSPSSTTGPMGKAIAENGATGELAAVAANLPSSPLTSVPQVAGSSRTESVTANAAALIARQPVAELTLHADLPKALAWAQIRTELQLIKEMLAP